ncbi:MAG TPA: Ku protein [Sandaracinaceae bacterium]
MAARTIWKGVLRVGPGVEVPVRLYSAVEDRNVRFRLLHATNRVPVKQRMVHPETGEAVERAHKGLEVEEGRFVVLTPEDLASVEPPPERTIELLAVVARERVDTPWYDRPYRLGPDGAEEDYAALAAALADRIAIARWTMRKRDYVGALHGDGRWLTLSSLRHLGEVVSREALGPPPRVEIVPMEARLAEQLVEALSVDRLDLDEFRDEHRERLMELIRAKATGKAPKLERPVAKREVTSLAESLRASLASAKERKVA